MIRKTFLAAIVIIGVVSFAIVSIGRHRRRVQPATPATAPAADNVIATVEVKSDGSTVPESDLAISDLKPDMLIAATDAATAPPLAEGVWINSDPTTLDKLRGHVVLVEFWTFGCYNCRNTLPSVKDWDAKYRDRGLTIVGVHTPETDSEYNIDNVRREVPSLGIKYAIVTDNDYKTWKAYGVEAWPTIFVLDKQGRIRWRHVGEGRYDETEGVIKTLLAEI